MGHLSPTRGICFGWMIVLSLLYLPSVHSSLPRRVAEEESKGSNLNSHISSNTLCQAEVTRLCGKAADNLPDLSALECILNQKRNQIAEISDECNHALWVYRKSITEETGFMKLAGGVCRDEFNKTKCFTSQHEPGVNLVDCLIDNKDKIEKLRCVDIITRLEGVVFGDYELIGRFAQNCESDILKYKCGRNDIGSAIDKKQLPHSQGKTIECLSDNLSKLGDSCAVEILRIAELQVDDFHLDRALYFACRDDREKFCQRIQAGNGRVYKCLVRHKLELEMSADCRDQIYRRQKLGWQDYKASGIVGSCRNEIKKYKCRKRVNDSDKHVRLSQILLCLENEFHKGQEINGDCLDEIKLHRKSLMDDFRVTPEVLSACTVDKEKFCGDKGLHGKTLHCLMAHAQSRNPDEQITPKCMAELENLLKISDVSNDWSVDPVLQKACQPVVERTSCSKYPPNQILDCLMTLIATDSGDGNFMTDECETPLIQIQFFLARDFQMDSLLFDACRVDASKICGAKPDWADSNDNNEPSRGPMILSCLFRNSVGNENEKPAISPKCADRVRATMRQRAVSVRLMPEIEYACMEDLTDVCSEKTKPGEELECLQDHWDELSNHCQLAVSNFTAVEMKNPTIDPFIWKHCRDLIEQRCSEDKSDDIDTLECLIDLKPEMKNKKCKISVEHLQLLRLKDIHFSPKFKTQCQSDAIRYCNSREQHPLTSWKLVNCLSGIIRQDIIDDNTQRVSKGCRKQVRYLILTKVQFENGVVDQDSVYFVCKQHIDKLCSAVPKGGGKVLECLRRNDEHIPPESLCHQALFKMEQVVDTDTKLDLILTSECEAEIKYFCPGKQENILQCLKLNSNKEGFDASRCGKVVKDRLIEENSDARLNPRLQQACKLDVKKFCGQIVPGHGRVIGCLKTVFVNPKSRLTPTCKFYIEDIMQRAAEDDARLDVSLYTSCKSFIDQSCRESHSTSADGQSEDKNEPDQGKIEECLKQMYHDGKIEDKTCKPQVALLIQTTMVDIHVDPILNKACSKDLVKHCDGVPPGEGRLLDCLLAKLTDEKQGGKSTAHLSEHCRDLLDKRSELFHLASSGKMESLQDLVQQVQVSPHKNYFLTAGMSIVGLIFIFGLFCGRVTNRRAAEKNK